MQLTIIFPRILMIEKYYRFITCIIKKTDIEMMRQLIAAIIFSLVNSFLILSTMVFMTFVSYKISPNRNHCKN